MPNPNHVLTESGKIFIMKKSLPISINKQDILLTKLQNYREDDFTNEILIPLFKELGYSDLHFNGGVYEEGKDLIAMKVDEFGDVEIAVAQVKKFKTTRSTANRQQLDAIIYQLRQCNDRPINYKDGNTYKPKDIFFITPYVLETKLLK
jgi:hypothetical protein